MMSETVIQTKIKRCRICGDKASGFNFNVLTCGPCRIFFHRNASKYENLKCPKDRKCEIDFATRKCCSKCRLDKCFSIGMKRKAVKRKPTGTTQMGLNKTQESSSASLQPQQIQILNHPASPIQQQQHTSVITHGSSVISQHQQQHQPQQRLNMGPQIQYLTMQEIQDERQKMSSIAAAVPRAQVPLYQNALSLKMILEADQPPRSASSSPTPIIEIKEDHQSEANPEISDANNRHELNNYELSHLEAISSALAGFEEENILDLLSQAQDPSATFSLAGRYAKKIINFCKSFTAFRTLKQVDQLNILRQFFIEILIIRVAFSIATPPVSSSNNTTTSSTTTTSPASFSSPPSAPGSDSGADENENEADTVRQKQVLVGKLHSIFAGCSEKHAHLVEENLKFGLAFNRAMEGDPMIRNLLTAIALFRIRETGPPSPTTPQQTTPTTHNEEILRYHYHLYAHLLGRYLEAKCDSHLKANQKFRHLLSIMGADMCRVRENFCRLFSEIECDQAQIGMLSEMFAVI